MTFDSIYSFLVFSLAFFAENRFSITFDVSRHLWFSHRGWCEIITFFNVFFFFLWMCAICVWFEQIACTSQQFAPLSYHILVNLLSFASLATQANGYCGITIFFSFLSFASYRATRLLNRKSLLQSFIIYWHLYNEFLAGLPIVA